jgi:hypothetical protein
VELTPTLRASLEKSGLIFNDPDRESFRKALQKSGFYKEWRERYGEKAWSTLEQYSGPLA